MQTALVGGEGGRRDRLCSSRPRARSPSPCSRRASPHTAGPFGSL